MNNEQAAFDQDLPLWFRILNIEDTCFEKSKYADPVNPDKFRLKDIGILRKIAPNIYESAADEIKEYNQYLAENDSGKFRKTKFGKRLGGIPTLDAMLHPELMNDPRSQDKYWKEHPEYKCK